MIFIFAPVVVPASLRLSLLSTSIYTCFENLVLTKEVAGQTVRQLKIFISRLVRDNDNLNV